MDFPDGGVNIKGGDVKLLFWLFPPENCKKMEKFDRGGGARPWSPA